MITMITMGKNGVVWTRLKGSPETGTTCNGDHMAIFCAPFRDHEVIAVVEIIQMRSFRMPSSGPFPKVLCFQPSLARLQINFRLIDACRVTIGCDVNATICI